MLCLLMGCASDDDRTLCQTADIRSIEVLTTGYTPGVFDADTAPPLLFNRFNAETTSPKTQYFLAITNVLPQGGWTVSTRLEPKLDKTHLDIIVQKDSGASAAVLNQIIHLFSLPQHCQYNTATFTEKTNRN